MDVTTRPPHPTRRGLLGAAGAVLASNVVLFGAEASKRKPARVPTMGDIQRLDKRIDDTNARVQGLAARLVGSGFSPGAMYLAATFDDTSAPRFEQLPGANGTEFLTPFPGSVIAISVIAATNYSGAAGSNYNDFEVYIDGAATGLIARVAGGSRSAYTLQSKGEDLFTSGARIQVYRTKTGSPLPSVVEHSIIIWVSFT